MKYSFEFLIIYLLIQIGFTISGYLYYSKFILQTYLQKGKLPFLTGFSQLFIFLFHGIILHLPYFLYASWPKVTTGLLQHIFGITIGIISLLILFSGFINLGTFLKTMGTNSSKLSTKGLYKFSRNPQVIGYGLFLAAYAILWPSWYIVISLISYGIVIHRMVLTEEIHLQNVFGADYKNYCKTTPRYIF